MALSLTFFLSCQRSISCKKILSSENLLPNLLFKSLVEVWRWQMTDTSNLTNSILIFTLVLGVSNLRFLELSSVNINSTILL